MIILIAGNNRRVTEETAMLIRESKDYHILQCKGEPGTLLETCNFCNPAVIIICLRSETKNTILNYDALLKYGRFPQTKLLVIGSPSECMQFHKVSGLPNAMLLKRPLRMSDLLAILDDCEAKLPEDDFASANDDGAEYFAGEAGAEAPAAEAEYQPQLTPAAAAQPARKRILVVDDDPQILAQIKENLIYFYDVTAVLSGAMAYRFLERHTVDLILLDYMMVGENGPEVLEHLRSNEATKDIPVMFLTGVSDPQIVRDTLMRLRPQGYLLKPIKKSELVGRIIDVLG